MHRTNLLVVTLLVATVLPVAAAAQGTTATHKPSKDRGSSATPAQDEDTGDISLGIALILLYSANDSRKLDIRQDTGTFVDRFNGTVLTRNIDNTAAAQRDLEYGFTTRHADVGAKLHGSLGRGVTLGATGSVLIGTIDVSYLDPERAETSHESSGPIGYGFDAIISKEWRSRPFNFAIDGAFRYQRIGEERVTRNPVQNITGGRIVEGEDRFTWNSRESRLQARMMTRLTEAYVGVGYVSASAELNRRLSVDFSQIVPGGSSDFTGHTALHTSGPIGVAGGGVKLKGRFRVNLKATFGTCRNVSGGITYLVRR